MSYTCTNVDIQSSLYDMLCAAAIFAPIAIIVYLIVVTLEHLQKQQRALDQATASGISSNGIAIKNTIEKFGLANQLDSIEVPTHLICPYTKKMMINPCCNVNGITVDREPYEKYLKEHGNVDPLTGLILTDTDLYPNIIVRGQIIKLLEAHARQNSFNPHHRFSETMTWLYRGATGSFDRIWLAVNTRLGVAQGSSGGIVNGP